MKRAAARARPEITRFSRNACGASQRSKGLKLLLPIVVLVLMLEPATAMSAHASSAKSPVDRLEESGVNYQSAACSSSLQSLVDGAASGSTLIVPACLYRETVVVPKPLTLVATPGAEIRGSNVWTAWTRSGTRWLSSGRVPSFPAKGSCSSGSRCLWPEQVFYDGNALQQAATGSLPGWGQFALTSTRQVLVADSPSGHTVEVTMRTRWIIPRASGIVIDGFRMRHAASNAQDGGITDGGYRITVRNCVLSDAHGAVVSLSGSSELLNNDISRGGQLGVHNGGALVRGNRIHHNNTEGFSTLWEAGGLKSVRTDQTVQGNEVYSNYGPGLWFDIHSARIAVTGNRVHDNAEMGIVYEISSSGTISGNTVWRNGWGKTVWGWGGGIVLSSSRDTEVFGNTLAWNADGISVISQRRGDVPGPVTGNYVHDNVVALSPRSTDGSDKMLLGWLQDWGGTMYDSGSNNRGERNQYWHYLAEPSWCRFGWAGCRSTLAEFNATPGDTNATYVSRAGLDSLLTAAGIPTGAPVPLAPAQGFPLEWSVSGSYVPVRITWGVTTAGSGVIRYSVQQSVNGGTYQSVGLPSRTTTNIAPSLRVGSTYRFRVGAQGASGDWSDWAYGPSFRVLESHESSSAIAYTGSWAPQQSSAAWGGYLKYSTLLDSHARYTFWGRSVAWVAARGPTRGRAYIYVDGRYVTTVDLYRSTEVYQRLVFRAGWRTSGSHTVDIRVRGWRTRPRVDVDGFVFLR